MFVIHRHSFLRVVWCPVAQAPWGSGPMVDASQLLLKGTSCPKDGMGLNGAQEALGNSAPPP
jgi:hypothetical protein